MASGEMRGHHSVKEVFKKIFGKKSSTDCDQLPSLNSRGEQYDLKEKVKQLTVADVDALLHYIEAELERLDPSSSTTSSPNLATSVLSGFQTQKDVANSFVQTLPPDITKEVTGASRSIFLPLLKDTLGGMGGVHWAGLGLSFIAWSLDNMDRTSQNHENCLKLLRKVVSLLSDTRKKIGQLEDIQDDSFYMRELQGSTEVALRCAIVCSSSLGQHFIKRFFQAAKAEEVIAALEKELDGAKVTNIGVGVGGILAKMPKQHGQITFTSDSEDMVGGDEELQTIFHFLNKDCDELVAVCLHGMGGIGKSTRAMCIYQKFDAAKRYRCCRVGLAFEAKDADLKDVQWEILQKISRGEVPKFSDVVEGQEVMRKELSKSGAVVLYLDNLMEARHLSQLLPKSRYFPSGSKLLITTRNKNVFLRFQDLEIKRRECFEIKKLGKDEARELFFKKFGRQSVGRKEKSTALLELEDEVVRLCDGLPLALKVVSSYIANSEQDAMESDLWKDVVESMRRARPLDGGANDDLYSILKFSIDQLNADFKEAFLDIVAFAVGKSWEYAERFVGKNVLEQLSHRSLIEKVTSGERYDPVAVVSIHDMIYSVGKQIARDDQCDIRITCPEEFLQSAGSLERIVGLSNIELNKADLLLQMPRVRVLDNVEINVEWSATQLQQLKAIKIRSSLARPMNFNACSGLKQLFWQQRNVDLEVLRGLTQLEALELYTYGSGDLANVEAIKGFKNLKHLQLHGYANFQSLPKGITSLKGLTSLWLMNCASLESIPEGISCLTGLKELSLRRSENIRSLPEGLAKLVGLKKLDVRECWSLESLPEGIVAMKSLEMRFADFRGCKSLTLLPEGTPWCWVGVRCLNLSYCTSLQRLPIEILGLTELAEINLTHCSSLRSLPEGIASLSKLREMVLDHCSKLEFLPKGITGLASLEELSMFNCYDLQSLPKGLANLTNLKKLHLGVGAWQSLPEEIGSLTNLQALRLKECTSLQSLPEEIAHLISLEELHLSECEALKSLPEGITCCSSLRVLDLSTCRSLESLPQGIAHLTNLERLDLSKCEALKSLPEGITCCSSLQMLDLSTCRSLESLPQEIAHLTNLERLNLSECEALKSSFECWTCLRVGAWSHCHKELHT